MSEPCVKFWTDTIGMKIAMPAKKFKSALIERDVPGKEADEIMDFLNGDGYVADAVMSFEEGFKRLVGKSSDVIEAIRKMKKTYDTQHFVFHQKRAILIGNKCYDHEKSGQKDLPSAHDDVDAMKDFLIKHCNFDRKDVDTLYDKDHETVKKSFLELRDKWAKKLTSGDRPEKGLLFVYYSGHGQIANNVTNVICPDGTLFPLPLAIFCPNKNSYKDFGIGITVVPNTMAVVFLDCCRLLPKNDGEEALSKGEYYIYYAVEPGKAASTSSGEGAISEFTKKVLHLFENQLQDRQKIVVPDDLLSDLTQMEQGGTTKVDIAAKPVKLH